MKNIFTLSATMCLLTTTAFAQMAPAPTPQYKKPAQPVTEQPQSATQQLTPNQGIRMQNRMERREERREMRQEFRDKQQAPRTGNQAPMPAPAPTK